jgi:hypothetical protein
VRQVREELFPEETRNADLLPEREAHADCQPGSQVPSKVRSRRCGGGLVLRALRPVRKNRIDRCEELPWLSGDTGFSGPMLSVIVVILLDFGLSCGYYGHGRWGAGGAVDVSRHFNL